MSRAPDKDASVPPASTGPAPGEPECVGLPDREEQRQQILKALDTRAQAAAVQHKAADPLASVFVNANAGSGKTYLLVNRVIRLLLDGARPESILCITYTRAAAAEMRSRLFARLAQWIHLSDAELLELIRGQQGLNHQSFHEDDLPRARQLFALALETPGGLQVQTIHAFCERLLQAFPVEAGMPPGFEVMDEAETRAMLQAAKERLLSGAAGDEQVRAHLSLLATHMGEDKLHQLLGELLGHRHLLARMAESDDFRRQILHALRNGLGVEEPLSTTACRDAWVAQLREEELAELCEELAPLARRARKAPTNDKTLNCLKAMLTHLRAGRPAQVWEVAKAHFLRKDDGNLKAGRNRLTSEVRKAAPVLAERIDTLAESVAQCWQEQLLQLACELNTALLETGTGILALYEHDKERLGKFDYDDLILRALELLEGVDSAWVLYRLDGGIEHVLLDEAQDTSPLQWNMLARLTEEFSAGVGAERANDRPRTVFAVGDMKQSIYSFQGAEPEAFQHMREHFRERFEGAQMCFRDVQLKVSFRTVPPILRVVDKVLEQEGFRLGEQTPQKHESVRPHMPGFVEMWPLEEEEPDDDTTANDDAASGEEDDIAHALRRLWSPPKTLDAELRPRLRLAARIADTIRHWLDSGEALPPDPVKAREEAERTGQPPDLRPRPIRPRDILILVRNRTTLMEAIVSALKQRDIPVAGVDRLKITEHIAVQDMLALMRFLLLPADDLSLAAVLKSPLLARDDGKPFDDDDLLRLRGELFDFSAPLREIRSIHEEHPLWHQLRQAAQRGAPVRNAVAQLRRWRREAGRLAPFEMLAHVLWRDGGLRRFQARLGHEALEPLEALLDLALHFEREETASLAAFVQWLLAEAPQIKRELEGADDMPGDAAGAVRVMTVHGAKGLESPIVFLADTTSVPDNRNISLVDMPLPPSLHGDSLPLWSMPRNLRAQAVQELLNRQRQKVEEEYNRLLYVAMTRAAERLYICGAASRCGGSRSNGSGNKGKKRKKNSATSIRSWHDWLAAIMCREENALTLPDGRTIWRYPGEGARCHRRVETREMQVSLPPWASRPAPPDERQDEWLTPSRLPGSGEAKTDSMTSAPSSTTASPADVVLSPRLLLTQRQDHRLDPFRRGTLVHKLLQYLPEVPPEQRRQMALQWLMQPGRGLREEEALALWREVEAVLREPLMETLFGPSSRAEVPFAARLPNTNGRELLASGQIDRLAVLDDQVIVADFKTTRPVPQHVRDVPESYVRQLALYRFAASRIWPQKTVRGVLVYTAGPKCLELPAVMLDAALRQ